MSVVVVVLSKVPAGQKVKDENMKIYGLRRISSLRKSYVFSFGRGDLLSM